MSEREGTEFAHEPVLRDEVTTWLALPTGGVGLDCTVGGGSHLAALAAGSAPGAEFYGIDRDRDAVAAARHALRDLPQVKQIICAPFGRLSAVLGELHITRIDRALFDLGVSSYQIDTPQRGFSFQQGGPLDMRMDTTMANTAADLVNTAAEAELSLIFFKYGEERRARRIAAEIVRQRAATTFSRVEQLRETIERAVGKANLTKTLARIFQALRIAVNDELGELERALPQAVAALNPGGRIGVISYHSLEDRTVKDFFRSRTGECVCPPGLPVCACGATAELTVLTRKPVTPTADEIARNPRSRSAKFRVAEKLEPPAPEARP
ncbi:MAG TPA: 16S rRNA (cytosine(1402)-N(4))-methyltransferase RsmH [candidate division Zixibacteria bacterium]|nr:16S rRNA (cytosine(1402)-N(4))-methyltransferase RsmH [candidate division Zixibacteria bacterium]